MTTRGKGVPINRDNKKLIWFDIQKIISVTFLSTHGVCIQLRPPYPVNEAYRLPPIQCCFIAVCIGIKPSQNPWFYIRVVPSVNHCMRWKAVLSSFSNHLNHLSYCQIPTCFTVRQVFRTKFHPINLEPGRVKVESDICTIVWRIF